MEVEPEIFPDAAEMFVVPAIIADASPEELIMATAMFEEVQVTLPVMFCIELFE